MKIEEMCGLRAEFGGMAKRTICDKGRNDGTLKTEVVGVSTRLRGHLERAQENWVEAGAVEKVGSRARMRI